MTLEVGAITETVTVTAEAPEQIGGTAVFRPNDTMRAREAAPPPVPRQPSQNVQNLQRLASGVLPVRIDVPRTGTSHRFAKLLALDEEVAVSFRYRRR